MASTTHLTADMLNFSPSDTKFHVPQVKLTATGSSKRLQNGPLQSVHPDIVQLLIEISEQQRHDEGTSSASS